jgi:hypothetical protein
MLDKAIRRTATKKGAGTSPSASFLAFPSLPDVHFIGVAQDSTIVFDPSFGPVSTHISLIRAKGVSQALLSRGHCEGQGSSGGSGQCGSASGD